MQKGDIQNTIESPEWEGKERVRALFRWSFERPQCTEIVNIKKLQLIYVVQQNFISLTMEQKLYISSENVTSYLNSNMGYNF